MDIEQIQEFFFKAMMEGWAIGGQKFKIPEMPGYKAISFQDGGFYLLDFYCVTPNSLRSAGTTTIWFQDIPVWIMNYGGYYAGKGVMAFLKRALCQAYEAREFVGGRGPHVYSDDQFIYVNQPRPNCSSKFEGREEIFSATRNFSFGYHEYWGMSLL
jgi:hypothetical protein